MSDTRISENDMLKWLLNECRIEAEKIRGENNRLEARAKKAEDDYAALEALDYEAQIGADEMTRRTKEAEARVAELEAEHESAMRLNDSMSPVRALVDFDDERFASAVRNWREKIAAVEAAKRGER